METNSLILYERKHRNLLIALAGVFFIMLTFRIHGFSLPIWHSVIDDSKPTEILYGKSQPIRSDDWLLELPHFISQTSTTPSFSMINPTIGLGTNLMAPIQTPIKHSILIFRPTAWGFFAGADFGLSWMWWSKILGIFYGAFLLFLLVTRNHFELSLGGAFLLIYSPYLQFWSFHKGEILFHSLFCVLSFVGLCLSSSRKWILINSVLLGWSGTGLFLDDIYPPIQVIMGYFCLLLSVGLVLDRIDHRAFKLFVRERILGLFLALLIGVIAGWDFYRDAAESIRLISNTVYPGLRIHNGGGFPFSYFYSNHFFLRFVDKNSDFLSNICESADFLHFFPLIMLAWVSLTINGSKRKSFTLILMAFHIIFLIIYTYLGFPAWLGHLTLMDHSTPNRTQLGIGVAELILLLLFLAERNTADVTYLKKQKWITVVWAILLAIAAYALKAQMNSIPVWYLIGLLLLNITMGRYLLIHPNKKMFIGGLALVSFIYTFPFNPLVRGGYEYISKNPLAERIRGIHQKDSSPWVVYGKNSMVISNYLRMIGVPSLSGYLGEPRFNIWKEFDPAGQNKSSYNQLGFSWISGTSSIEPKFRNGTGTMEMMVSPIHRGFSNLGVKYFLAEKAEAPYFENKFFKLLFSYHNFVVYEAVDFASQNK